MRGDSMEKKYTDEQMLDYLFSQTGDKAKAWVDIIHAGKLTRERITEAMIEDGI